MKQLKHDMTLPEIIALGIGSVIGAGIFALLGQVVILAGRQTYAAFILAGVAALFSGYSYAKLAGKYHNSGGLTEYFHIAFRSKWVSGGLSLIYVFTSAISISMMAKSFGFYVAGLFNHAVFPAEYINYIALALILLLAVLNMMGASDVGKTEILLVVIKVSILVALVIAAIIQPEFKVDIDFPKPTGNAFMQSVGITFFAYAGYGVITNATADVAKPKRTIVWGIYLTLLIVMLLYLGLAHVVLNYSTAAEIHYNSEIAVTEIARKIMGKTGYFFIYLAAAIAFVSGINATFFSIYRINRSLSEQKILPKFYEEALWRNGTYGNLLTTSIILAATVLFDFSAIVNLSSAAYLVSYLGVFAAAWKLRRETDASGWVIVLGALLMIFIFVAFISSLS